MNQSVTDIAYIGDLSACTASCNLDISNPPSIGLVPSLCPHCWAQGGVLGQIHVEGLDVRAVHVVPERHAHR